jgi:hypothetical protein
MFGHIHPVFTARGLQPERVAYPDPGAKEPHPVSSITVGAMVSYGRDHSFGSSTQVFVALE